MIAVENVTKNYGGLCAVRDVSFDLKKGEVLGMLGPNGAGKTTLMRIMTGYIPATSGRVTLDGVGIEEKPLEVKRRIGYLPELPPLYTDMSVRSYVRFAAEIKGVPRGRISDTVEKTLHDVGLMEVADRLIENISKGYRQRVGLAQALVHHPDVLILDEPTVGLDPHQIIEIRNLIRGLSGDHSIILSTHILPEASAVCDRVVILNEGRVAAIDTQEELTRHVHGGDILTVEIAGGSPDQIRIALEGIGNVTGVTLVSTGRDSVKLAVRHAEGADVRASVFKTVAGSNWTLLELSRGSLSLEEVFLRLTREEVPDGE